MGEEDEDIRKEEGRLEDYGRTGMRDEIDIPRAMLLLD